MSESLEIKNGVEDYEESKKDLLKKDSDPDLDYLASSFSGLVEKKELEEMLNSTGDLEIRKDLKDDLEKFKEIIRSLKEDNKGEKAVLEFINSPEKMKNFHEGYCSMEINGTWFNLYVSGEKTLKLGIRTDAFVGNRDDNPELGTGHNNAGFGFLEIKIKDDEVDKIIEALEESAHFKYDDHSTHTKEYDVVYEQQSRACDAIDMIKGITYETE